MNTNTMDKQEKSIAEKLNQLTNITTFWDDVRKHTTKSMSTATMRKWEYLADRRYAEIFTGVEDVRVEVEEYGKPMRYYAPDGKEVFPKEKRSATKCKDSNGKEILTGMIIRISNAENKSDNGLFFVAESPCDLSWKNQTVHVLRKIDEYGVELNYVSFYPLISFDENGNEITLHSDAEIVKITDTGFSEISQYFINKKMQANIKWNHTLNCFGTVENRNKQNEEIEFYQSVIGNIKNGFKASIAEENVEKPTNTEEQPENPKGESIMNESKNNTMPNGNYLDINGKEITTGAVVEIRNAYFKTDNGLYFVEHSPSDPTWSGTSHSLSKLCRNGKISTTKYSTAFYPLATFTNNREKRIEVAEHNSKYAEIEIVDFSNMENIIAHFNEELAQQRKTSQRNMWHYGENSDICSRDKEIEEFLQSVIDRISGKSEIIDDNVITSMHNTENLTAETPVTEQPTMENPIEEPKTAWTGRANYAEHRMQKAERYAERAEKARATADRLQKPINDMHGDIAFFTQPNINTSAGRAFTNQRNRMFASYEKGFEERAKAAYYDEKSENLSKEPTAISSDDPEALRKLKGKLEKLTAEHKEHLAHNKALNKAIKNGTAETNKFGWATLNGKSYYFTTNETAEIRRLKDRISELESLEIPEDYEFDGGTVVFNTSENRVQILFDEIPDSETRENLKRNGFKWSPRQQAWQRMLNTTGIRTVKRLYPMPEKPTEENSVEETSQPTTENIVYPFILVDTPTAQPETTAEETIIEAEENPTAQPVEEPKAENPMPESQIKFDEALLNKARQMYYKVNVDSVSDDGNKYIDSKSENIGVRVTIIPSDSWDYSLTFYTNEEFVDYMNEQLKLESEFWSDEVAQPVEESVTENHMTREEILQAIEEETKASISPQQILFYGEKLLKSVTWVDGIRNKIAKIAFWKYGNGADKDFEILTIEVDRIQQNILDSLFKKETVAEESLVEEQPVENPTVAQSITTEQKFNETLAEKEKQCDLLNEMYQKHYDVDRPDEYYAAWGKLAEINKQLSELEARAYEEMKQSSVAEETITVEDTEIAVEKIPEVILEYKGDSEKLAILKDKALSLGASVSSTENHLTIDTYENHRPEIESVATELGLKTDEEMHKTFNAVQGKINEVGTIEQKNIIYKIPWGIYRRYSAKDITNVVLARTNDILAIKTENRLKAVSALIADNMEKSGMTAEQKTQAEIAMKCIDSPDKLNDYVCSTEENSADNSTVNGNNTTAEQKIRPPPFLKDFLKI